MRLILAIQIEKYQQIKIGFTTIISSMALWFSAQKTKYLNTLSSSSVISVSGQVNGSKSEKESETGVITLGDWCNLLTPGGPEVVWCQRL